MSRGRLALAAGTVVLALLLSGSVAAYGSPAEARAGGVLSRGSAWWLLVLLACAFAAYLVGVALLRRTELSVGLAAVVALAVQSAPLAGPLVLSSDAWTYWAYGRVAAIEGGNPYDDPPSAFPGSPAYAWMGADWRRTTSVYGPAFMIASEPVSRLAGDSQAVAAWCFRIAAAAAACAAALLAARLARRRALALALVGWNPVVAFHLAGGGHNDAWVGALVVAALALVASRREGLAGVAWVLAVAVKWVPIVFLALWGLARAAGGRRLGARGLGAGVALVAAAATWRYGLQWLEAFRPLAENATLETSYAIPHRLQQLGLPHAAVLAVAGIAFAAGFLLLARRAVSGRPVLGRAAVLLLATTPWLAVWYLGWALPVTASEEDAAARIACLGFCAYLLPQTIPL